MQCIDGVNRANTITYDLTVSTEQKIEPNLGDLSHLYPSIGVNVPPTTIHVSSFLNYVLGNDIADIVIEYANEPIMAYPVVSVRFMNDLTNPRFTSNNSVRVFTRLTKAIQFASESFTKRYGRYHYGFSHNIGHLYEYKFGAYMLWDYPHGDGDRIVFEAIVPVKRFN